MLSKMEPRAVNILQRLRQKIEEREGPLHDIIPLDGTGECILSYNTEWNGYYYHTKAACVFDMWFAFYIIRDQQTITTISMSSFCYGPIVK